MMVESESTRRLNVKKQTLDDAYAVPANFLEIDVLNPMTTMGSKKRYTDYEVKMKVMIFFPIKISAYQSFRFSEKNLCFNEKISSVV